MSSKSSKTSQQFSQGTQTSGPEAWMKSEGQGIYNELKPLAEREWQGYGGERVADLGQDWNTSRDLVQSLMGPSQNLGDSRSMLEELRAAPGNDPNKSVQDYVNPYVEGTLGTTLRKLGQDYDQRRLDTDRAATMGGAFGDARHGIADSQDYRNHANQVSDATYKAESDAWDKGQNQQNTVLGRLMAMPGLYQALDSAGFNRQTALSRYMNQFAAQDQALRQAKDNAGYSDFLEKRGYKANNLNSLIQSLNAVPHDTTTTSQQQKWGREESPDNSGLQLLGKLGGTVLGGMFGGPGGGFLGGTLGSGLFGGASPGGGGGIFGGNLFGGAQNTQGNDDNFNAIPDSSIRWGAYT